MKRGAILLGLVAGAAIAAPPAAIPIDDDGVFPESIAAAPDGTLYIGTMTKGMLYRAAPGAPTARPWIDLKDSGIGRTMGLLADPRRKLLWACTYPPAKPGEKVPSTIVAFDLGTGALRRHYAFEGTGCNDMAIAADGTVYASDFNGSHIMRLARGDTAFRVWADDPAYASVDGLAFLADGSLIADTFRTGTLLRIPIGRDGAPGKPVTIATARTLVRPDGMRAIGPDQLLLIEGEGRLDRVTVTGDSAAIVPVREGIDHSPTGVAIVRGTAYLSIGNFAALRAPDAATMRSAITVVPLDTAQ